MVTNNDMREQAKTRDSTTTREGTNASADEINAAFEQFREAIKKLVEDRDAGFKRLSKQIADLDSRWAEKWKNPREEPPYETSVWNLREEPDSRRRARRRDERLL